MAARLWCCHSICWIIFLVFLAWPLAMAVAFIWILLQPFEACCPIFRSINRFLERLVTWPREFGQAISNGSSQCPYP